ncbi:bis(5'-nucleosyl)-tetraphosphatase (symmetrical) YqeK [Salinibacillus xinjiangensis]|uniref:bis(5'-nucleosyl)-tetraphosphatase (symmetrical) n=1 Tax=Salinibacillus xinjiangensis TaxID=1229268 RepID=A0A6G1X6N4_9BACI|nr:bis(5'-nucleosyl)-tetraphosphatase (symmetrical) YqeK [Salinibacillus xinjiangensis]MRG86663.1 HD domain-containing protein [Salinibacillus xinjiangensis]
MDLNDALEIVRPHLKTQRYEHTVRVVDTAVKLAKQNDVDQHQTELAAAFHDIAKYHPKEEMERTISSEPKLPKDLLEYHHELWHGPVGAYVIENKYGINDEQILNAIRYHTTGRAHMGTLEKVVFLADYIEPGRKFPGVDEVRESAWKDLNQGCRHALKNTINFLMSKKQPIYPDTFQAYNDLTRYLNN